MSNNIISNEDKFLDLNYVARLIQEILGNDLFEIGVNSVDYVYSCYNSTIIKPEYKDKICGALKAERRPFSVSGTSSETISFTVDFRATTTLEEQKQMALFRINKILGNHSGTISAITDINEDGSYTTEDWRFNLHVIETPNDAPITDTGEFISSFGISGDIQLSLANGGGVVGNFVKNYIILNNEELEVKVSATSTENAMSGQNFVRVNKSVGEMFISAQAVNSMISGIYQNNKICHAIRDFALHEENQFGSPAKIKLKKVFPDKTIIKDYFLISAKLDEESGAYIKFELGITATPEEVV